MSNRLQVYETNQIRVSFDPTRCAHSGVCLRTLPEVFDLSRGRWVDPSRASADQVMAAVAKCPSGALQSSLVTAVHPTVVQPAGTTPAGEAMRIEQADPAIPLKITVRDKGSLLVEGPFKVVDAAGNVLREGVKCSLCRCGHSNTKPFCDSSHETIEDIDW